MATPKKTAAKKPTKRAPRKKSMRLSKAQTDALKQSEKPPEPTEADILASLQAKAQQVQQARGRCFDQAYEVLCKTYACKKSAVVIQRQSGTQYALETIIMDQPPE